jgi:Tol biopolymer transport system component/tRNA A-37 threonylcarbamoyl transferase component Bud32
MTHNPGDPLGPYRVVEKLGEGGMGEVYRARDTKLNRDVAIKVLPEAFALDRERLARFEREAQTLAALNHPNVAHIHGVLEAPPALVMELVEGEDLSAIVARGPIPVGEALPIARQIADGLEAAHEQGIVHRDLKPGNIKVRADGTVKVLDFGLARGMDPARASSADAMRSPTLTARATELGVILGTAAYMAPEQARGKAVDRRADIWAFGVVLYEMLTGTRLFTGDTISDVMAAVLTKEPDLAAVPAPWRRLVSRCLEKDPRRRLRDVSDAWFLLDSEDVAAASVPAARSTRVWAWALVALLAGAAATWTAMALTRPAGATDSVAFVEPPAPGTRFVSAPMPSPDGRRLAWIAADASGRTRLWTREIRDASPHAVDGTDGLTLAFWSPDSQQLAFEARGQVRRVAPGGGPVSLIVAANLRSGVWLADNDLLLSMTGGGLMRVPATGGSLRPANGFTSEEYRNLLIEGLTMSSDGRCVMFSQFGGATGIYVARPDGTGRHLLYPGEQSPGVFVGSDLIVREDANVLVGQRFNAADMTLVGESFPVAQNVGADDFAGAASGALSFIAGAGEISRLTWFTREGKPAGTPGPEGEYGEVAISRGGRWLGFVRKDSANGNVDVWLQALAGGAPIRFTSDPDIDHLFTISHDDRDVAWEAHAKGTLNLMRRPADGSRPARLVRPWSKAGGPMDWSPDGRIVLYQSLDGPGESNLWAVPADGAGAPVRLTEPGADADKGQFSPDGSWLAYVGSATGQEEVYVQRVEGMRLAGGPIRVSENGGRDPLWRRDGSELFFMNGATVLAAAFNAVGDRPAAAPRALFTIAGFAPGRGRYGRRFAVTPDGQRFVATVSTTDGPSHPATVVLNWRQSLDRK